MLAQPVVGLVRPAAGESSARAPRQGTRVGTKGSLCVFGQRQGPQVRAAAGHRRDDGRAPRTSKTLE